MDKLVNSIKYEIGDIVIRKSKAVDIYGNPAKAKEIESTDIITTDSGFYQVLYFKGETFPGVAWEYEPYNEQKRKEYYDYINSIRNNKSKSRSNNKGKSRTNPKSNRSDINVEELAKRMFK